jgi:ATP adenylyltransferase
MRLADVQPGALLAAYRSLRARLALGDRDGAQAPYNLLVTRRWMMLIPRRREHAQGISVNALGYAGSLFVRDGAALQALRETGPLGLLREVGLPPG